MQFSAKTKNEAITKACIELGVSSDQLDIQVVSEGSSGFFGIGSKPAIIKARKVYDNSEEKEIEKIVDSVKINAFKEDTVKETQKSAPKSVSRQNDVKPETKTETAKASKEEKQPRPAKEKPAKEKPVKEQKENQAVDQAIENAQMDIPEAMIEFQVRQMADDFARRIQQQGLTVEQYFQFTGMTAEKMMEEMRPQAEKSIKTRLVLEAIVKAENIEVSDERVEEELTKMAEAYQMEVEKLKEFMGENEKKQIKEDLAVQEAITLLVNESVEG